MAKPTGPLLSLTASGTIADTLTYSRWKGRPYIRTRVIPANPQTTEQSKTRNTFSWASDQWKNAPSLGRAPWDRFAQGQVLSGRNAFIGRQTNILRAVTVVDTWVGSPGAKGGIAAVSLALTPAALQMTVDVTVPTAPTDWTLTSAIGALLEQQDPQSASGINMAALEDVATPFSLVFTGLEAATVYVASVWLKWLKPDGSIAYGASINAQDTTP